MTTQKTYTVGQITPAELDALSARHPQGGFQQTSHMATLAQRGGITIDCVGVRNAAGTIVAGCMIAFTKGRFGLEGSIWLGPLCDEDDAELLAAMTRAITICARKHHAVSVSCWPGQVYMRRTTDGEPDGSADDAAIENMTRLGWRHAGFDRGYGSIVNRWVYLKDLTGVKDGDALLKTYLKNTRRNVKIARNSGVTVRRLGRDELDVFHDICEMSAEKQHFSNRDLAYFQRFYDSFGDDAQFMLAEVHLDEYLATWQGKFDAATKEVERLEGTLPTAKYPDSVRKKIANARRDLDAATARVADATERIGKYGEVVPVAVGLFVWHPRELVYFSSGSNGDFAKFYAPTALQHEMMSECIRRGVTLYNFYGISGLFDDPDDEGHGVLEFKQGFDGFVEELVGEFTLPVSRVRFALMQLAHKILKR